MNNAEFQLRAAGDPRLAVHAASPFPAWLWSVDGTRVLWANPVGARVFGAADAASLASKTFGPADSRRRQVAHLAHRLPPSGAIRLERLRGFGAPLGTLMTCGCTRLDFADGVEGVLIVAAEPLGRAMPIAPAAAQVAHVMQDVADRAPPTPPMAAEPATQNVAAPGDPPTVEYERATMSGEAPAEFALIDEFADTPETAATDAAGAPCAEPACATATKAATGPGTSRTRPLRLSWQMDAQGRFSLGPDEFSRLIGVRGAAGFSRPWREIADTMGLDPEGRVERAIAARENLAGIAVNWPVDGGNRLRIELSGSPILDAAQGFVGYRGFGVCRDLDGLARLEAMRRHDFSSAPPSPGPISGPISTPVPPGSLAAEIAKILPAGDLPAAFVAGVRPAGAGLPPAGPQTSTRADLDTPVETETPDEAPDEALKNVVPFRPIGEARTPALTAVENSAFNELARQLSARLDGENWTQAAASTTQAGAEPPAAPQKKPEPPSWLTRPEPPAQGESVRDRMLLDLLPDGILIYRLDRLLYANPAFLERIGYASLHALEQAGGLDALYVAPGVSSASSTSDTGTPVTISAHHDSSEANPAPAIDATLHAISWDEETAHALIFSAPARREDRTPASAPPLPVAEPSTVGHANAEELAAILDTAADGIVMFDAEGNLNSCNRSAEALFGYEGAELVQRNLVGLFAPESQGAVLDYLASLRRAGLASLLDHGREVLGRVRSGGLIPLSVTMGRTQLNGPNFFAVFRDLSQAKKSESELRDAQRLADRAADAKADLLARISHEIRSPLNAIIGFAEVMIGERFGALGNERYLEYMKDIRASGERVVAIIDELTDLSQIETGKLDLSFTRVNLNDLVENCVGVLQGEANRERIIIRTSLAHMLPPVVADARALRQIALNLIANSIHLANAGGQVIVSTALTDFGDVVLRVRDTGNGLNDDEVAAAMEPFRTQGPSDQAGEGSPVSLSLTKALVEANRAKFHIRTGARSGTLVEVVFSTAMAGT